MSVELDPPELGFKRMYSQASTSSSSDGLTRCRSLHTRSLASAQAPQPEQRPSCLQSQDHSPQAVRYSPISTSSDLTANVLSHRYCVRPNSGRIDAGGSVEVSVLLQAMKEDPPEDAKCRDKFLVQSVAVNAASDSANVAQIWSNIEQSAKSQIQEKKIRVSFLPADGGASSLAPSSAAAAPAAQHNTSQQTNGIAGAAAGAGAAGVGATGLGAAWMNQNKHEDEPPAYTSPTASSAVTPQKQTGEKEMQTPASSIAQSTGLNTAAASVSNAVPTSQAELQQQLDAAKDTISRLQAQAAEGLRQRKPQEAAQNAVNSVQQSLQNSPAPGGVSIPIVAGLCLLCFLIAYLFF